MTPLYRFLAARVGRRLAPPLMVLIYGALLLAIVLLGGLREAGHILYLDLP